MESNLESQILQKNVDPKIVSNTINEVMDEFGMNMLKSYLSQYEHNGGAFVRAFIKFESIQLSCAWVIRYALRQGLVIDENEKVKKYVEGLGIAKPDVLEKLLNVFRMIKG